MKLATHHPSLSVSSFLKPFSARYVASARNGKADSIGVVHITDNSIMARFRSHQRKKSARSIASEDPWKVDTPFGPPRITTHYFPGSGIRRIRNTLSKLSPSARAERELLRQKNRYKIPLTERNMDTFVTEQEFTDARYPDQHTNELHIAAWLDRLSS
ncbi:hypothetical protein ARAM_004209 [Aspergillus rambellii]|uniref:Uncharacterized protein n=1 Tax=Aspergillus rambellii TaxID=308745 RepID=A0A0F8V3L1_9EURO|nr:hypothetical protein ARAM_004209 [Aspergillus rambellii]